jgi:hypothetical protein
MAGGEVHSRVGGLRMNDPSVPQNANKILEFS